MLNTLCFVKPLRLMCLSANDPLRELHAGVAHLLKVRLPAAKNVYLMTTD